MARRRSFAALFAVAAVLPACAALRSQPAEPAAAEVPQTPPADSESPERTTGSAGKLLVYSAITGHVPMQQRAPTGLSDAGLEAVRAAELEAEIADELAKQEDVSDRAEPEQPSKPSKPPASGSGAADAAAPDAAAAEPPASDPSDPRVAPSPPQEREIPLSLFDSRRVSIPAGTWGNAEALEVVRRSLDVDDDGRPEQVRYFDPRSGKILREERDSDYDGRMDAWLVYSDGVLSERVLDSSGDGRSDVWEHYAAGQLRERMLDRNDDSVQDAFFRYQDDALAEERHDADDDGRIDLTIHYENLRRVRAEEDLDRDGRIDTWTTYQTEGGQDHPARVEHDSKGRGSPDVVETYEVEQGKALLARREEDLDGDGDADVVSIYEHGKLVAREISDPELTPL